MKMYDITVLPGDGVGPEIMDAALLSLDAAAKKHGFEYRTHRALIGGAAVDAAGDPLPRETVELCQNSDAVLLGAVGGPKYDALPVDKRPEKGLLGIRKALGLFANLRPVRIYDELRSASPLKDEILQSGVDLLIVRELTGGIYFGERGRREVNGEEAAYDTELYTRGEIERIVRVAVDCARKRRGRVCSVDKANVMESSRFWRGIAEEILAESPDVRLEHMYVDNAAMQLVRQPGHFDVVVTSNMFGDILSDEASQLSGSIGLLPSASLSSGKLGLYEPIHGSAPDIAGKDIANPIATILSAAMLLRYSLDEMAAADTIEAAVSKALKDGLRTADIAGPGERAIGTAEMGERIAGIIEKL